MPPIYIAKLPRPAKSRLLVPRIMGAVWLGVACFISLAVLSFYTDDPSLNRVTHAEVQNLAGRLGAYLADPLLQWLGIAVALPLLWLMRYGGSLAITGKFSLAGSRLIVMFATTILVGALLALTSPTEKWVFLSFGGILGWMSYNLLTGFVAVGIWATLLLIVLPFAITFAFHLSARHWGYVWRVLAWICLANWKLWRMITAAIAKAGRRSQNKEQRDMPEAGEGEEIVETLAMDVYFPASRPKRERQETVKASPRRMVAPRSGRQSAGYQLPSTSMLAFPTKGKSVAKSEQLLQENKRELMRVLKEFGIDGKILQVRAGPVVVLYELQPAAGIKASRIISLADDIARSMSALAVRIAAVPGRNVIGIELPNPERETVYLRELLDSSEYRQCEHYLPIVLGKDIAGDPVIVDLAKMPHLLVAGTTGSGKSVGINTMILSLLYRLPPDSCKFIMIDPKMLELSVYDGIPHLLCPVVTEPGKAVVALKWVVKEMEQRYRLMSHLGVRNIGGYNQRILEAKERGEVLERLVQSGFEPETGRPIMEKIPLDMNPLPFIVVIVDEMADLMLVAGKDIETSIQRLAQMARAAGIHIIMATQRPSVDVITGVIKANFPTRISFQVTSRIDSRTILSEQGAEQLLGMGDMLYMAGGGKITRVHGPFVSDKEVEHLVAYLRSQQTPEYIEEVTVSDDEAEDGVGGNMVEDPLYDQAVALVLRDKKASTSYIQRYLKIGYNRAATIIERMEREGLISPANHVGKREVLAGGNH
jgi:S-DNA-T family DNA segregation ATPase FtsK/SpoIIIE